MSPEQLTRQAIRLDRRTDVWSLGVCFYQALTLNRPFEAPTREGLYQAILTREARDPRRWNPSLPRDLSTVVLTALEKDRDRRYQTALLFAEDLKAIIENRPVTARHVGPFGRHLRWSRREPAKAALFLVLLIALPSIAALATVYAKDRPQVEAARLARLAEEKDEILSEASYELAEGDALRALRIFEHVLGMGGGSPEAAAGIALAHLKLREPESALRVLDAQASILGHNASPRILRADALRRAIRRIPVSCGSRRFSGLKVIWRSSSRSSNATESNPSGSNSP